MQPHPTPHRGGPRRGPGFLLLGLIGCSPWAPKEQPTPVWEDSASPDSGPDVPDADGDGHPADEDCDDADASVFPGAEERCNGADDDCDGETDEGVLLPFYADADRDGFGDDATPTEACEAPDGFVPDAGDCDDDDGAVHPDAEEVCNSRDDDCDGDIDEDGTLTLYEDTDGDGWGDSAVTATGCPEVGWVEDGGDCDDDDPTANPGIASDQCDGVDSDCDGDIDEDSKVGWSLMSVNTNIGSVLDIDPTSGALTDVAPVSTAIRINSMDVNANRGSIVHIARDEQIASFDACTGAYTVIGAHGAGALGGISFGPDGRLFGLGGASDALWEFDLATGVATQVGPLGIDIGSSGLAWDCTNQRLYGADTQQDRIFEIDLATGEALNPILTDVPFSSVGLEFDRVTGLLLASTGTALYTIDPATGASTYIGPMDAVNMDDLAWHPPCL